MPAPRRPGVARSALTSSEYRTSEQLNFEMTSWLTEEKGMEWSWQSNSTVSEILPLGRSEMAIDGLRPEDHEVVSGGSLHKCVSARRKKARLSFVPLIVEHTHYGTNVARDDLVRGRNNDFKIKVLSVRG